MSAETASPSPDHGDSSSKVSLDAEHGDAAPNGSFLVHSQKTLTPDIPPKVDNKALLRQRRRRTSPEDHAVLEAEYQKNPKPDKATRASIVSRVSLGDKEVQIWFQNRRQNDRRRSKPLQPHEYLQPAAGVSARISDERSTTNAGATQPSSSSEESAQDKSSGTDSESNGGSQAESSQNTAAAAAEKPADEEQDESRVSSSEPTTTAPSSAGKRKRSNSHAYPQIIWQSDRRQTTATTSTSAPPSLRISLSFDGEAVLRKGDEKTPSPPRTRNEVRLSFSADGEAVVRTATEPSPCKDRRWSAVRPGRFAALRRSQSAVSLGMTSGISSLKEKLFGRSRDSRAWELQCDTDARSALSVSRGDTSSNRPFTFSSKPSPLTSRRDLPNVSWSSNAMHPPEKRPKLSRTVSSLGRLESNSRSSPNLSSTTKQSTSLKPSRSSLAEYHDGDSDKENWIPGTQTSAVRRRRRGAGRSFAQTPAEPRRASALADSRRPNGIRPSPLKGSKNDRHLFGDGGDSGLRDLETVSQVDDLDCIQGLLSLSQGAWR